MGRVVVRLAALGFLFVACGGSSDTTSGGAGPTTLASACTNLATAYCQKIASCGSFAIQRRFPDQATCVTRETTACNNQVAAPDITRGIPNINACATAYGSATCADVLATNTPAECRATSYPGKRAIGAACVFSAQCQSGECVAPRGTACGTCAAAAPAVGAPCPQGCGPGQYCHKDTGKCTGYGNVGDACDDDTRCNPTLGCVGSTTGSGQCATPATTAGAACQGSIPTGTPCLTDDDLVCSNKQCVAAPVAATGAVCGATTPATTLCTAGALCNAAASATGTCVGPAADGAPCATGASNDCLDGAVCLGTASGFAVTGTCTVLAAALCP